MATAASIALASFVLLLYGFSDDRTVAGIYRQAQVLNSSVALVGLSHELRSVLAATGFLGFFVVADTVADGVEALAKTESKRSSLT